MKFSFLLNFFKLHFVAIVKVVDLLEENVKRLGKFLKKVVEFVNCCKLLRLESRIVLKGDSSV